MLVSCVLDDKLLSSQQSSKQETYNNRWKKPIKLCGSRLQLFRLHCHCTRDGHIVSAIAKFHILVLAELAELIV